MPEPTIRDVAREAARAHLAALFPDHGLTPDVAEGIADAVLDAVQPLVRGEVLAEAEQVIRTTDLPAVHIDLFDNGADWAADLVHDLGATPSPTSTPERLRALPPGEFGDLVRKITPTSQEN